MLAVSEIFKSIQGETTRAGLPCVFVRTAGCNLHCTWCDTEYARTGQGTELSVGEVFRRIRGLGGPLACITGGEPMLQAEAVCELARRLLEEGWTVMLETNGSIDTSAVPDRTVVVMDVKCPGSGEAEAVLPSNLKRLGPEDEVKFVILNRTDFDWAVAFLKQHGLLGGPHVLFGPVAGRLAPRTLAEWILESGLPIRLQMQLHRLLWPEAERGV